MKLIWDKIGERFYETGVSNGVLFVADEAGGYGKGVAWNGLINVTEQPSGAEPTNLYADNVKYLSFSSRSSSFLPFLLTNSSIFSNLPLSKLQVLALKSTNSWRFSVTSKLKMSFLYIS